MGHFFLDPTNRILRHDNVSVALSPKAFDALVYLVRNRGRLLTREELIQALWPDSYVEEGNLSVHIFQVRKALSTAADGQAYIQTVPKKGYRFNAEVKVVDQPLNELVTPASDIRDVASAVSTPEQTGARTAERPDGDAPEASAGADEVSPWIRSRSWQLLAGGAACLVILIVIAVRLFPGRQEQRRVSSPVRLTSFSPELFVSAAAISPDGETLAYANPVGLFLEEIVSKETRALRAPVSDLRILNLSWFPDGSRLLVTGAEPDAPTTNVWIVPVKGMTEPERVGPFQGGAVSPDASHIALVHESGGVRELLLLPSGGGKMRRIAAIPVEETLGSVFWSVDSKKLQFVTLRWNPQLRSNQGFIRFINVFTETGGDILSAANLSGDAISLPDGRLIYGQLLGANPAGSYGAEMRQWYVDPQTENVAGDSVSLGRWAEQVVGLSASRDGRRLTFRTILSQHSVYEGDLGDRGEPLSRVRRVTLGQGRDDFPRAWTPDSKAIFFDSNRNGKWEIFKQASDQISDEPYLQGASDEFSPSMSPDGRALLYLDRPRDWHEPEPVRLMRVSTLERFPEFVLQASGYSEWGLRFECGRTAGSACVMAQRTGGEVVFRRFDSERGFTDAKEALRVPLDLNLKISWALAPDGSHLAWIVSDAPDATIHVAALQPAGLAGSTPTRGESKIVLKDLDHLHALNWSPDGRGWYVSVHLPASWKISYTNGVHNLVLWQGRGEYSPEAWPSPDGRHLAFSQLEQNSNAWMLENF